MLLFNPVHRYLEPILVYSQRPVLFGCRNTSLLFQIVLASYLVFVR